MVNISTNKISEAVYNLCLQANTCLDADIYNIVYKKFINEQNETEKQKLYNILKNAKIAYEKKRPLCQDTGQVIIFLEIGENVKLEGNNLKKIINEAVEKSYNDNYFRKSVVHNAIFDRTNTNTNTPAIIYTDIIEGEHINIKLLVKGAGSENYSNIKVLTPTATRTELFEHIKTTIANAGEKSCPPFVIGIGAGGTIETAGILSKLAFFETKNTQEELDFLNELKNFLKECNNNILDIKIKTTATHIASLPVAITMNCHSTRHAECSVTKEGILYKNTTPTFKKITNTENKLKEIQTSEIDKLKKLVPGERFLLTGKIYTARDAAHKKLLEEYKKNKNLKIELKDKIIFYAGPCPSSSNEVIGPIGPTTSARMDAFMNFMQTQGLFATIGKGERSNEANKIIQESGGKYFTAQGGIASLLAKCVKENNVILYEDLGPEAIRELYVEKLPLTVDI